MVMLLASIDPLSPYTPPPPSTCQFLNIVILPGKGGGWVRCVEPPAHSSGRCVSFDIHSPMSVILDPTDTVHQICKSSNPVSCLNLSNSHV